MTIIIDPQSSGISGNMIIAALVDLGADKNKLKEIMEKSAQIVGKINVNFKKIDKQGIAAMYCHVEMLDKNSHVYYNELVDKINALDLDEDVKKTSINIFKRIAIAESKVHGKTLEEIHFHEVGASDAVADIIGSVWAYYSLNLDKEKIIGLPIAVGGGQVKTSHGILPVPAPAVLEILKDLNFKGGPVLSELATPTGCAIYAEICDEIKEFIPLIKGEKVAYGAGSKDFEHPNILKKNRQGSLLKIISQRNKREKLINLIFKETGSLGIRIAPNIHRGLAKREFIKKTFEIKDKEYEVTFKIGYVNGEIISKRPEYEDLKKIAEETGLSLREIKELIK